MLCRRCLLRAAKRKASPPYAQNFSISQATSATAPTAQPSTTLDPRPGGLPAATSTSAAQPFSESNTYSPSLIADLPIQREKSKPQVRVQSSVPAGTVLKGLNFVKGKMDPIALEDAEYPDWLWGVLDKRLGDGKGGGKGDEGDLYSKSKKQRRVAAKALKRQQLLNPEMMQPKIPIYEQSIDLPAGDGSVRGAIEAGEARQDLTKAMRDKRRAKIKEDNFLKAMR